MLHCKNGGNAMVLSSDQSAWTGVSMLFGAARDRDGQVNTLICAGSLLQPRFTPVLPVFSALAFGAARQKTGFFAKP